MQHRHICNSSDLQIVADDPGYKSILPAVELEANENLFAITKFWLSGAIFLNSEPLSYDLTSSEVYVLDGSSEQWLWEDSRQKRRQIDDNDLTKFLALAKATYAIINFSDKSRFFMFVSS
jgi:hypothetical protein